jgi:hypothetical protein
MHKTGLSGGARAGAALSGGLPASCHARRHAHHVQVLPAHQQRLGKVRRSYKLSCVCFD